MTSSGQSNSYTVWAPMVWITYSNWWAPGKPLRLRVFRGDGYAERPGWLR